MKSLIIHNIRFIGIRMIWSLFAIFLLYLVYFFHTSSVQICGYQINNPFYTYVEHLEWWFYILVYFTIISILNTTVFFVLSFYFILKKEIIQEIKSKYEFIFSEKIISYIYSDFIEENYTIDEYFSFFKKSSKSKLSQETLFLVITRTQEMIAEDLSVKFTALFENSGLKKRLEYFLYSRKLSEKIIAMKIISYLYMKGYEKVIARYAKKRNYVLRTEAMTALIRLSEANRLNSLLSQQHYISRLDLNIIVNAAAKNMKDDCNFQGLIKSPSPRLAAIGLMLVKIKNKIEYKELIKPILENKDELLNEIAWEVYAHFASTEEDFELMTVNFKNNRINNKLSVMKALKRIEHNKNLFDFLDKVIRSEPVYIKIEALKILLESNIDRLLPYEKSSDENIVTAYNEVVDFNIS